MPPLNISYDSQHAGHILSILIFPIFFSTLLLAGKYDINCIFEPVLCQETKTKVFQKIGGDVSMGLSQEVFLAHLQEKGPVKQIALKIPIRGLHFMKKIKRIFTTLSKYVPFHCLNFMNYSMDYFALYLSHTRTHYRYHYKICNYYGFHTA